MTSGRDGMVNAEMGDPKVGEPTSPRGNHGDHGPWRQQWQGPKEQYRSRAHERRDEQAAQQ